MGMGEGCSGLWVGVSGDNFPANVPALMRALTSFLLSIYRMY